MSHSVPNALMTGADYLDSLRDGRQVYLNGERVADVTRHRAFRNACRSIAGLYDGLHGEQRDVLTRVDAQAAAATASSPPRRTPRTCSARARRSAAGRA